MSTTKRYSPDVRERAVRMVFEHQSDHDSQWAAMESIASKIGCTAERTYMTLSWVISHQSHRNLLKERQDLPNPVVRN